MRHKTRRPLPALTTGQIIYEPSTNRFAVFLMNESPPQLTSIACRYRILSEAMKNYPIGMILKSPEQSRMHCIPFFNTNQYQQNQ